jgi:hypothetical protein
LRPHHRVVNKCSARAALARAWGHETDGDCVVVVDLHAVHEHAQSRGRLLALSARLAALAGDEEAANEWREENLSLADALDEPQALIYAHRLAAYSALDRSAWVAAAEHLHPILTIARESQDQAAVVRALEAIGELLTGLRQPQRALRLAGTADAMRQTLRVRTVPIEAARLDRWLKRAREAVGTEADAAHAAGRDTPSRRRWTMPWTPAAGPSRRSGSRHPRDSLHVAGSAELGARRRDPQPQPAR